MSSFKSKVFLLGPGPSLAFALRVIFSLSCSFGLLSRELISYCNLGVAKVWVNFGGWVLVSLGHWDYELVLNFGGEFARLS